MAFGKNIKQKLLEKFKAILTLDSHPGHIALGLAVGVFISFTPFFGLHTPMAIAIAFIFRLNKIACITGAWVNTPFTVVPVLLASYKVGSFLSGETAQALTFKNLEWNYLKPYASSLLLGSSIIGFLAAVLCYFICYWLILSFRRKDEGLKEIAREMEEVGEELK
jgi:uncharacterized protein (TIGR03546 family)